MAGEYDFQDRHLAVANLPVLLQNQDRGNYTVGNQLTEAVRLHQRTDRRTSRDRAAELLTMAGIPDPARVLRAYAWQLSGGQRQRAMIAMALAGQPRLLIADEPTTALDVTTQAQILNLISDLRERTGMAIMLITHDLSVIAELADEVVVMHQGKLVEQGPVDDIFHSPHHEYTRALLDAVPSVDAPSRPASHSQVLLRVRGLSKSFPVQARQLSRTRGHVRAVDDVSFDLFEGETLALVGESGSGKTTTARAIVRAIDPDAGAIQFRAPSGDVDLAALSRAQLRPLRPHLQMIFQDPHSSLNPRLTIADIIGEPLLLNGMRGERERTERVAELLTLVGLPRDHLRRFPHAFSGGQRQRIGIARAIALNPRLIVADEPVTALDVSVRAHILDLLLDLQANLGLTYLFVSHDLGVVKHISNRVAVMYAAKLVELAPSDNLFTRPRHPYTAALLANPATSPAATAPTNSISAHERSGASNGVADYSPAG